MGRIGKGNSEDRKSKNRGVSGGSKNWFRSRTRSKIVPYFIAKLHP
jgi:hypothetical protein